MFNIFKYILNKIAIKSGVIPKNIGVAIGSHVAVALLWLGSNGIKPAADCGNRQLLGDERKTTS